jgi:hypothetical protein
MRSLIEDILNKGDEAIKGKNPHTANVRFTHDSYVGPLLSAMGYDGCIPQCSDDLEAAATSYNQGKLVPMAANLQIILYRNKEGKILVRPQLNERDVELPIKSVAPHFYDWNDIKKLAYSRIAELDKIRKAK